jgi:hypothetical protein
MKKLLFTIAIGLVGMTAHAQTTNFPTLPIEYKVVADSMSKEELYNAFLIWVGRNFKSATNVIKTQNLEAGVVIVKFKMSSKYNPNNPYSSGNSTDCSLEFNCKDGKYRLIFDNISFESPMTSLPYSKFTGIVERGGMGSKMALKYLTDINNEITSISNSIELDLKSKPIVSKNNDW